MIKLSRSSKPVELTPELQRDLTALYKSTGQSVWNIDFLKNALRDYSFDKCCYCEANITEESKYLEVEHFHPKNPYHDEVMEWENLLPSCKKCNGTKNDHDTITEPIIDPTIADPKKHLKFWNYRMKSNDGLGKLTISVLDLNNQDRLVVKRFEIGSALHEELEKINELLDEYVAGVQTSTLRKNRIVNGIKKLMKEGLPQAEYSATSATVITTDNEFYEIKDKLSNKGLWDEECVELEDKITANSLDLYKTA